MAENPYDRTDPTHRDAWEDGYFAGREDAAKIAERWVAGIPKHEQVENARKMLKGYLGPFGGRPEDLYAAIRAGEVRG